MFLSRIHRVNRIIPANVKHGDKVVALRIIEDGILFKLSYINNQWLLMKEFDYNSVNLIPKEKLINISLKLKKGEINYSEIRKKNFLFIYDLKEVKILFVSEDDNFVSSLRIDAEFYSQILEIPCIEVYSEFIFDVFKTLAFTEDVAIQKIYDKDTEKQVDTIKE